MGWKSYKMKDRLNYSILRQFVNDEMKMQKQEYISRREWATVSLELEG